MAIERMGHFTAIGMRTPVPEGDYLVINTCGGNDTDKMGDFNTWIWSNPTNRAIEHIHPNDPNCKAVSVECIWQGTKILTPGGIPDPLTLNGEWRRGKAKRPIGAWNGPNQPLITSPGEARRTIYIPAFKRLIEHWLENETVAGWVSKAKNFEGDVYLRDFDTGRGVMRHGPMSHAWVLAMYLNNGVWPQD